MKEGKEEEKGERRGEGEEGEERGREGERRGRGGEKRRERAKEGIASLQNITQMSSTPLGNISEGHGTHKHIHVHTPTFPE